MSDFHALVIGASGGLGQALVDSLLKADQHAKVHCVSRTELNLEHPNTVSYQCDSGDESQVRDVTQQLAEHGQFNLVICCIGTLHDETYTPEKRLEDIDSEQLLYYFSVNTVAPSHWLKHGLNLVKHGHSAHMVFFSARVASISDNRLGGWYGYRASKAALNMMIKTAQIEYARRAKQTQLVCYHPGTVDTDLSKPFQGNVKPEKLFSAHFSASQLLKHLRQLHYEQAPHFIDWQGESVDW